MELMSIGKFAKKLGISVDTLRRMHASGEIIPARITRGGTRYYSSEQLIQFQNIATVQKKKHVIGYCRVSTRSQLDDLQTQVNNVKSYMFAKGYQFEIITDVGSGINYKKPGLTELLRRIDNQEISKVVILYKDRLIRFGFELIEQICLLNGVGIEVIDNTEQTKEQELVDDLIQIITVFANRLYGQRSKKTRQLIEGVKHEVDKENKSEAYERTTNLIQ